MQRSDARFSSGRDYCAAWLYWPAAEISDQTVSCVVMAHGFSVTRHDGLPYIAERFAQAGYAVLLFDYRYFGESGGQPRQRFWISAQLDDWRNAIAFARGQRGIDPDRIVLWGFSFSGGHVVAITAQDHRVAAALVLCPFLNGLRRVLSTSFAPSSSYFAITPGFVTTIAFYRRLSRAHRITCPLWVGLGACGTPIDKKLSMSRTCATLGGDPLRS
ncbi:MAG: alpha/beta hydrolase [Pseudonocardiaceae bacterium]